MEDREIVNLYMSRDESAISHTAEKYGSRIRGVAYGITLSRETADECENDTYLRAWNAIPPDDPTDYFFPYLARTVRNVSIDRLREKQAGRRYAQITEFTNEMMTCLPSGSDTETEYEAKRLGELISEFLKKDDKTKRKMFVRRYFYLDSIAEIADRFGVSENRVKQVLFRMREKLRKYLSKEGYTF